MIRLTWTVLLLFGMAGTGCQSTGILPSPTIPATLQEAASPTATLELSPTLPAATETLLPPPQTFTEDFNGSLPYWAFLQIDNGQTFVGPSVQGGYLVFDLPAANQWAYALYARQDYTDVRVDTQIEVRAGNDGAVGLVCRYSQTAGWYELNIYSDQSYSILFGQWLSEGIARYTPLFKDSSGKIKAGSNQVGLLCQADILTPFINDVQMKQTLVSQIGLKSGTVGISASSFQSVPFTAAVDWVKVSLP